MPDHLFIHFSHAPLINNNNHYECVVPNIDINLQSGRFWATSVASFRERFIDFRSCWVVFIHRCLGDRLQCSNGKLIRSAWRLIRLYLCTVAEQGEMPCLNSSWKVWLIDTWWLAKISYLWLTVGVTKADSHLLAWLFWMVLVAIPHFGME